MNMGVIILENDRLTIRLLPDMGGRILSFFRKDKSFELAAPAREERELPPPAGAAFAPYAYGMDDTFPSIDGEEVNWKGRKLVYPDHGEIWSHAFEVLRQEPCLAVLLWQSEAFGYRYEKTLRLEEETLHLEYRITNRSEEELPCIWTWHGLMRYEEDMRILLPEEISHYRNVMEGGLPGPVGTVYPADTPLYDFGGVPEARSRSAVKFYGEERTTKGCCGLTYPSQGITCLLRYDAQILPWFGVWITAGGFQGDYNCALEPSSGFYDSIGNAKRLGRLPILPGGGTMEFGLSITLIPAE